MNRACSRAAATTRGRHRLPDARNRRHLHGRVVCGVRRRRRGAGAAELQHHSLLQLARPPEGTAAPRGIPRAVIFVQPHLTPPEDKKFRSLPQSVTKGRGQSPNEVTGSNSPSRLIARTVML